MSITFREPVTLAERIEEERRAGNVAACAVSVGGTEPVYGEVEIANAPEPDRYTAFAQRVDRPGPAEWHVKVEGHTEVWYGAVRVAFGIHPERLNYRGLAYTRSVEIEIDKLPMSVLQGSGPIEYDANGEPA